MCPFATILHYSSHASHADIVGGVAIPQGCPEQLGCKLKMKEIINCVNEFSQHVDLCERIDYREP